MAQVVEVCLFSRAFSANKIPQDPKIPNNKLNQYSKFTANPAGPIFPNIYRRRIVILRHLSFVSDYKYSQGALRSGIARVVSCSVFFTFFRRVLSLVSLQFWESFNLIIVYFICFSFSVRFFGQNL